MQPSVATGAPMQIGRRRGDPHSWCSEEQPRGRLARRTDLSPSSAQRRRFAGVRVLRRHGPPVGLARLRLSAAPLFLLDEPYGAIDDEGRILDELLAETAAQRRW